MPSPYKVDKNTYIRPIKKGYCHGCLEWIAVISTGYYKHGKWRVASYLCPTCMRPDIYLLALSLNLIPNKDKPNV